MKTFWGVKSQAIWALVSLGIIQIAILSHVHPFVAVPVIVVYTKYDKLVGKASLKIDQTRMNGLSNEDILTIAKEDVQESLREILSDNSLHSEVPHIVVSSECAAQLFVHLSNSPCDNLSDENIRRDN